MSAEDNGHSSDDDTYEIPVFAEPEQWKTAFVVGINQDGEAYAHADIEGFLSNKEFDRSATGNDMWLGAVQVQRELETTNLVQNVVQNFFAAQMQIANQIQQQAEAQRLASKLDIPGMPRR